MPSWKNIRTGYCRADVLLSTTSSGSVGHNIQDINILSTVKTLIYSATAGLTEAALEAMAEQYRETPVSQAAPDLASNEWPDLSAATTNGKHSPEAG